MLHLHLPRKIAHLNKTERFEFMSKDDIYSQPQQSVADFNFDDKVAAVFPDMIKRSVPGYAHIVSMIGLFAQQYAQPNTHLYDLGSSLGAVCLSMRHRVTQPGCTIVGIDNSADMLKRSQTLIDMEEELTPVELILDNIEQVSLKTCSVVALNFTLQFIDLEKRAALIEKIYQAMSPGGILILSEKLLFDDNHHQDLHEKHHWQFKRANGYSDLEISQKRAAIDNVLVPETLETHLDRLQQAGFINAHSWFQSFNFASIIAFKP